MDLQNLIDNAQKLPNIPKVVQELIESFGDDNINNEQIAKRINSDQVLTAKVLRAANSAYYGGNRNVSSVNDAVFLLGFNAVRTLVLATGITSAFKIPEDFDAQSFWRHSFAVASICKWLARFSRDDLETAFTCGMIHSIGKLLIHILLPSESKEIQKQVARGKSVSAVEKNILGFDFAEVGAELTHRWKFPEMITEGVRYQLDPANAPEFSRWAALIHVAVYILLMHEQDKSTELMEQFPLELASALDLKLDKLQERLGEIKELIHGFDAFIE